MPKKKEWSGGQFGHGKLPSRTNNNIGEEQENTNSDTEERKDDLTANFHQKNVRNEDGDGVDDTINADKVCL
jgi:hypothetical protein